MGAWADMDKPPERGCYLTKQHDELDDDWTERPRLAFEDDLVEGKLTEYRGQFVAYQKSNLVGVGENGATLYNLAADYFGRSSLAVFEVPERGKTIQTVLNGGFGRLD